MATDALYWQTVLNLNFNGDLTDISPTVKTLTANGSMAAGTAQLKIGSGSLTATAASSQYLSHAQHADFDFGSGDFCIEFYWRPTAANVDYSLLAYALGTVSTTADMCVIIDHLGTRRLRWHASDASWPAARRSIPSTPMRHCWRRRGTTSQWSETGRPSRYTSTGLRRRSRR